jgi:Zn2+/Cd2+-exporting ATPase
VNSPGIGESTPHAAFQAEEAELRALPWMVRATVVTLAALAAGRLLESRPVLSWALYAAAYLAGGFFSVQEAWRALRRREFDVNALMVAAALGAAALGEPFEGAILMFLFSLSSTLETFAMSCTHASIRALLDLTPRTARVIREQDGRRVDVDVPVDEVRVGDLVRVRPGEQIPADGVVVEGHSEVNQSTITGEAMPVEQAPGGRVFAGTLNGQGGLIVEVSHAAADSTLARIVEIVAQARERKARSQDLTDRVIGKYYAWAVVGMTLLAVAIPLLYLGGDVKTTVYRAMTLMVVASPCAVVISIPASLLSALAAAARGGVLFKGGVHMEAASQVKVIAFDKTGTLTTGRPGVASVVTFTEDFADMVGLGGDLGSSRQDYIGPMTRAQTCLLCVSAAVEKYSEHPIAQAILRAAGERGLELPPVEGFRAIAGSGAFGVVRGHRVRVGKPASFGDLPPEEAQRVAAEQEQGRSVVLVGDDSRRWGMISLEDTVRLEAAMTVAELKKAGIERVVLLTGDNRVVSERLGRELGADEVHSELLPEQKVTVVRMLRERYGHVAMVGDGVNDAPALASAELGIAMGAAGADVALESADVVLMSNDLSRLPGVLRLARRARVVVRQNLAFAFAVAGVLVVLALSGTIVLPVGVIGHEGSTLLVVANGLRLLLPWR